MGDRTKIADALDDSAATIRGVGMWQERNGDVMSTLPSIADLMERAAGLLRADPDTSDDLFTEARRLLDAAMSGPLAYDGCFVLDGVTGDVLFECDSEQTAALFAAAPRLIAALLAERDADVSAGAVARTVAMSHIAAERDAERAARERAEAEARQLREAIGDPDELIANAHYGRAANGHGDDLFATVSRIAAAVAEGAEDRGQTP